MESEQEIKPQWSRIILDILAEESPMMGYALVSEAQRRGGVPFSGDDIERWARVVRFEGLIALDHDNGSYSITDAGRESTEPINASERPTS
jgi:DNA-binding PadR family transcriptional regulator